jgi:hypothetical protein
MPRNRNEEIQYPWPTEWAKEKPRLWCIAMANAKGLPTSTHPRHIMDGSVYCYTSTGDDFYATWRDMDAVEWWGGSHMLGKKAIACALEYLQNHPEQYNG